VVVAARGEATGKVGRAPTRPRFGAWGPPLVRNPREGGWEWREVGWLDLEGARGDVPDLDAAPESCEAVGRVAAAWPPVGWMHVAGEEDVVGEPGIRATLAGHLHRPLVADAEQEGE